MTIEIRELVIQAKVESPDDEPRVNSGRGVVQQKVDEARWVELVARRVLEMIREEEGRRL